MALIKVKLLWAFSEFVGYNNKTEYINSEDIIESPKAFFITKNLNEGNDQEWDTTLQDPGVTGTIEGVLVGLKGRPDGVVIDGTLEDVIAAINAAPGTSPEVTPVHDGTFPIVEAPTAVEYTLVRRDDGTMQATERANRDYSEYVVASTFFRSSRNTSTGASTYKFKSLTAPRAKGMTDTVS